MQALASVLIPVVRLVADALIMLMPVIEVTVVSVPATLAVTLT